MTPYYQRNGVTLYQGDALTVLRGMPEESVQCVVTSPPYWGLRDYGTPGQLGLEPTLAEYVARMVEVFREVRRVLRADGVCWLNMGDSYAGSWGNYGTRNGNQRTVSEERYERPGYDKHTSRPPASNAQPGLKPKDLVGVPWMLAFALRDDGWWLRSDIVWSKPNPMPESVTDRPTKAHEYVFMLTKAPRYFFDQEAVRESAEYGRSISAAGFRGGSYVNNSTFDNTTPAKGTTNTPGKGGTRNLRSVWSIATQAYPDAHFATYPEELPRRCILAGTSAKGCCPECGKGWERVVERSEQTRNGPTSSGWREAGGDHVAVSRVGEVTTTTTGWRPGCECEAPEDSPATLIERPDHTGDRWVYPPAPCTVLDPFAGSGTTLKVARSLGRHAIGIELSPEYCELAIKRINEDPEAPKRSDHPDQGYLLGEA